MPTAKNVSKIKKIPNKLEVHATHETTRYRQCQHQHTGARTPHQHTNCILACFQHIFQVLPRDEHTFQFNSFHFELHCIQHYSQPQKPINYRDVLDIRQNFELPGNIRNLASSQVRRTRPMFCM